jgi:hypothetical protein
MFFRFFLDYSCFLTLSQCLGCSKKRRKNEENNFDVRACAMHYFMKHRHDNAWWKLLYIVRKHDTVRKNHIGFFMIDIFAIMPVKLPLSMLYKLHVLVLQCRVTMWLQWDCRNNGRTTANPSWKFWYFRTLMPGFITCLLEPWFLFCL